MARALEMKVDAIPGTDPSTVFHEPATVRVCGVGL